MAAWWCATSLILFNSISNSRDMKSGWHLRPGLHASIYYVLHIWQSCLSFSCDFICDRITCILENFYRWGHFVMTVMKLRGPLSVQSWTLLQVEHSQRNFIFPRTHELSSMCSKYADHYLTLDPQTWCPHWRLLLQQSFSLTQLHEPRHS